MVQRLFAGLPLTQRVVRWFTDTSLDVMMVITMWKYRYFKFDQPGHILYVQNCTVC